MQYCVAIPFVSVAAGTDDEVYGVCPADGYVKRAWFAPATAVTADGTNYVEAQILANDGAGGSYSAIVEKMDTSSTSFAVDTSREFTLTGVSRLSAGDMLKLAKTEGGTGEVLHGVAYLLIEASN